MSAQAAQTAHQALNDGRGCMRRPSVSASRRRPAHATWWMDVMDLPDLPGLVDPIGSPERSQYINGSHPTHFERIFPVQRRVMAFSTRFWWPVNARVLRASSSRARSSVRCRDCPRKPMSLISRSVHAAS